MKLKLLLLLPLLLTSLHAATFCVQVTTTMPVGIYTATSTGLRMTSATVTPILCPAPPPAVPNLCQQAPTGLPPLSGVLPALPRSCVVPAWPVTTSTVYASSGSTLQAAITAAQCGQAILLAAGVIYPNIVIPGLACPVSSPVLVATLGTLAPKWITNAAGAWIAPTASRLLAGTSAIATITGTANATAAVTVSDGAANWYLANIEITVGPNAAGIYPIVSVGDNTVSLAALPQNITFDRVLVHPSPSPVNYVRGGIDLNAMGGAVIFSAVYGVVNPGQDTQAIYAQNTPGPLLIAGSDLEASGENILLNTNCTANSGGTAPNGAPMGSQGWQASDGGIPTCPVASDVTVRLNHFRKQMAWQSLNYDVKNLFEIKYGQRVLLDSNILDTSYAEGQDEAIIMNCFAQGIYVCQDFTVTNNLVEHVPAFIILSGNGEPAVPSTTLQAGQRVLVRNNIAIDVNGVTQGGTGLAFNIQNTGNVVFDHNTIINTPPLYMQGLSFTDQPPSTDAGFQYTNNFSYASPIAGGMSPGQTLAALPSPVFGGDVFVGDYWPNINAWGGVGTPAYPAGVMTAAATTTPVVGQPACNIANKPIVQCWPLDWALAGFLDFTGGNMGTDLAGLALAPGSPYKGKATDGLDIGANVPAALAAIASVP
jgi:hypothetical protein